MLYKVWSKYANTPFLIASELLQKSFVVYSHVFFSAKNHKISFISKRKTKWQVGNYVTFFYTSFIQELVLSKSTRNNGDNESIFANQILVNLSAYYTLTWAWMYFSHAQNRAWFRIFFMLLKNMHWKSLKTKKRNMQIP